MKKPYNRPIFFAGCEGPGQGQLRSYNRSYELCDSFRHKQSTGSKPVFQDKATFRNLVFTAHLAGILQLY